MDEEEVTLRAGKHEDQARLRELVALSAEAARWVDGYPTLVAEIEGVVVGFVLYRVVVGEGEVLNVAVDPAARRRGVGRMLLGQMMGEAVIWHLEVRESNAAAMALYLAMGFEKVGRRASYYSDGEAALLLRRVQQ